MELPFTVSSWEISVSASAITTSSAASKAERSLEAIDMAMADASRSVDAECAYRPAVRLPSRQVLATAKAMAVPNARRSICSECSRRSAIRLSTWWLLATAKVLAASGSAYSNTSRRLRDSESVTVDGVRLPHREIVAAAEDYLRCSD